MVAKTPNAAPWHRCSHKQLFIYLYIFKEYTRDPEPSMVPPQPSPAHGRGKKKKTVQMFLRFSGYESKLSPLQAVHADLRVNEVINSWRQNRI